MKFFSIQTKLPVGGSDITPANFVAGGLYGNFHLKTFTCSAFCNSLKTFQIVGRVLNPIAFDLTLISERYEFIIKVFNGPQPSIKP